MMFALLSNSNGLCLTAATVLAVLFLCWTIYFLVKKGVPAQTSVALATDGDDSATALVIAAAALRPVDETPVALAIAVAMFKPAAVLDDAAVALALAVAALRPADDAPVALALAAASRR